MSLSRECFRHLIPHGGSMCLIDRIVEWDETAIRCISATHRSPDHPLAEGGRLHAICAVEYAAQAAALHGGLMAERAGRRAAPGLLAGLRRVRLGLARLDELADDLVIAAACRWSDAGGLIYEVSVTAGPQQVLEGQITVMLNAGLRR